jgi:tetratricopeptide (TPR) repeat protein
MMKTSVKNRSHRLAGGRICVLPAALFLLVSLAVAAQQPGPLPDQSRPSLVTALERPLSLRLEPRFLVPLGDSGSWFGLGGALSAGAEYGFKGNPQPFLSGEASYAYLPVRDEASSVSLVALRAGGGAYFWITPRLGFRLAGLAGAYLGFLNDGGDSSAQLTLSSGAELEYMLSPQMNISLGAAYRYDNGTYQGLSVAASTAYFLRGAEGRRRAIRQARHRGLDLLEGARTPEPGRGIELSRVEFDEIFPVFHKFYDDHPVGRAVLINLEPEPVTDVSLSFVIKQYMDSPKTCAAPAELAPGESCPVEIMALLSDSVLEVTEATKVAAELTLEYRMEDELYRERRTATLRLLDRNAMCWDDDRKAAAFVTAKDPAVLGLSKAVAGLVRSEGPAALNANLLTAMGLFAALEQAGLAYVVDPKTPFVEFSKDGAMVDYLQFPRQTLAYGSGDCDDLSILFAALLESVAVETAFITVPGHIFLAFDTGLSAEEAAQAFGDAEDFIVREERAWIPVETTLCRGGLLAAWTAGSRQWREAADRDSAGFYPLHAAWQEYEPVGLPGEGGGLSLPGGDQALKAAFQKELDRYIEGEIAPRAEQLEAAIRVQGGTPDLHNRLGILYARYGRTEQAEAAFRRACAGQDYVPALINLGNLCLLREQPDEALKFYEQAAGQAPQDPRVLLRLAHLYYETGRHELAREAYAELTVLDRRLAERYAYLGGAEEGGRAAASARQAILWTE